MYGIDVNNYEETFGELDLTKHLLGSSACRTVPLVAAATSGRVHRTILCSFVQFSFCPYARYRAHTPARPVRPAAARVAARLQLLRSHAARAAKVVRVQGIQ